MRDVLNIDSYDLSEDDIIYTFDIKGSLYGRRTLEDPSEILNYKENYHMHKNKILKDVDFFQSFRKLDITNKQSERIMSQFTEDINFLSQHNFVDYSLLIFVVIKPYVDVKSHLPEIDPSEIKKMRAKKRFTSYEPLIPKQTNNAINPTKSINIFSLSKDKTNTALLSPDGESKGRIHTIIRKLSDCVEMDKNEQNELINDNSKSLLDKTLYLSQINQPVKREIVGKYQNLKAEKPILIFKEKYKNRLRIYHVLNMNDINCIRAIEHDEKMRLKAINNNKIFQNDMNPEIGIESNLNGIRQISDDFEELMNSPQDHVNSLTNFENAPHNFRPSATFFGKEEYQNPSIAIGISRSSIVNFNSSVERQKLKDKQSIPHSPFKTNRRDQNYKSKFEQKMRDIDLKLEKECINCIEGSKENHIIEITDYIQDNDEDQEPIEEPWKDIH